MLKIDAKDTNHLKGITDSKKELKKKKNTIGHRKEQPGKNKDKLGI